MKQTALFLTFLACAFFTHAQLLLNENFDYVLGTALTANGWGVANSGATVSPVLISTQTISYSGYPSSGIGNEVIINVTGQDLNKTFTPQTSGSVFTSFIISVDSATLAGDYFFNVGASPMGTAYFGRIFVKKCNNNKIAFGLLYTSGGTPSPAPIFSDSIYDLRTSYLMVEKYVIDGDNSNTSMIINPAISATEPTNGWITDAKGTNAKPANVGTVALRQGGATTSGIERIDGIRVATSWAALFPTTGISNPSDDNFNVLVVGKKLQIGNVPDGHFVEIYNALGSKVQESVIVSGSIILKDLAKGLYFVCIGKNTQKIIL